MKTRLNLIAVAIALSASLLAGTAAEKKVEAGPKGGRLLAKTQPKAEFLVEKDHTVSIRFYDTTLKPVAAAEQNVIVIANAKSGKAKLEFEKKDDNLLVSKSKLPEGDGYPVIVQFKQDAEAKPQNFRRSEEHTS